LKDSSADKL